MIHRFSITGLAALALFVNACSRDEPGRRPERRTPLAVTTIRAETRSLSERLEAGGIVAAQESAVVSSRVTAPVLTVSVKAGDRVRAGATLVTLDARDVAAQARQARAAAVAANQGLVRARGEYAAALAEQKLAAAWHARIAALRERNSATPHELDEAVARMSAASARADSAQAAVEQADAVVAASQAAGEAAGVTESFTIIRAPFDGVITERLVDPGNLAAPGTPLLRIDATGGRRLEVRVDESRAAYISPGDRVEVAMATAAGTDEETIDGTVDEVARAVAADLRAFTVKVSLPDDRGARTGTFGRIRFRGPSRSAIVVPAAAIRRQGQVASVLVVQDGIARLRLVQAGASGPEGVEVLAGLDPGETVIVDPPAALEDGQPVSAASTPAPVGGEP